MGHWPNRLRAMHQEHFRDAEIWHQFEDQIHRAVLLAIADGHPDAAHLAAAALRSTEIDYARWYA